MARSGGVACSAVSVDAGVFAVGRKETGEKEEQKRFLSLFHRLSLPLSLSLSLSIPPSPSHEARFLRHGIERGAIPLERRQRPGGACAPRRGSGRLIVAKLEGEGEGAPLRSIPRSSSAHPTIGCRAAPLPPLATAPLPGPPRSPHSVLGITACSIELDARRQGARQRPPAPLCAPRINTSASLSFQPLAHRPFRLPRALQRCTKRRGQGDED